MIAEDGFSYERAAIEEWFGMSNTSPMTNEVLSSTQLRPNNQLRGLIESFQDILRQFKMETETRAQEEEADRRRDENERRRWEEEQRRREEEERRREEEERRRGQREEEERGRVQREEEERIQRDQRKCISCRDTVTVQEGLECSAGHFCCDECFNNGMIAHQVTS